MGKAVPRVSWGCDPASPPGGQRRVVFQTTVLGVSQPGIPHKRDGLWGYAVTWWNAEVCVTVSVNCGPLCSYIYPLCAGT